MKKTPCNAKCQCMEHVGDGARATDKCIKDFWLFADFSPQQLDRLKTVGVRRDITAGRPVFMQGDAAEDMFLIKSGRIKLSKVHEDGGEVTLDFRKPGDVIGENFFSEESEYPLSAWAVEDTVTCGFERSSFSRLVLENPDIGLKVIESMGRKMASMTDRMESMSGATLESRLYSVLVHVAREHGTEVAGGLELNFPLTHEDLGFLVGAHRVSITKAMKSLANDGRVLKSGRRIRLAQPFF